MCVRCLIRYAMETHGVQADRLAAELTQDMVGWVPEKAGGTCA